MSSDEINPGAYRLGYAPLDSFVSGFITHLLVPSQECRNGGFQCSDLHMTAVEKSDWFNRVLRHTSEP